MATIVELCRDSAYSAFVKTAALMTLVLLAVIVCVAQTQSTSTAAWHYPSDTKAIRSQEPPKPYKAAGLPDGTVSVLTRYRSPGFRVRRPDGGLWQFEDVAKLYYRGKLFAIVGNAKGVSHKGDGYLGWIAPIVIYDEDGDGKLESVVDINGGHDNFVFHLPNWLTR